MRLFALGVSICLLVFAAPNGRAEESKWPYPAGRSTQTIEGLKVELGLPEKLQKDKPASLVVVLHGAGGTATGMAAALREWMPLGYVVCAPKSKGQVWAESDVASVKKMIQHLQKVLPLDVKKTHVVGYSNGGWNLPGLAFDDTIRPCSATWIASGFRGAAPPKWAKSGIGVIALAGAQDANASSARETVKLLAEKVRSVEVRFQLQLGHEWPRKLMPYLQWWMGTQEGRFTPGLDHNFKWIDSIDKAISNLANVKKGGIFVYAYSADDQEKPHAKELQRVTFMGVHARHYGNQLQAVKLDIAKHKAKLEALGVTETPAIVILKKDGKKKTVLQGAKKLKARKVIAALKSVAPNKKKPQ